MVLEALDITHHFTSSEKCYYMKKWSLEEGKYPSEGRFSTNTNTNNNNNNNNECNVISGKSQDINYQNRRLRQHFYTRHGVKSGQLICKSSG